MPSTTIDRQNAPDEEEHHALHRILKGLGRPLEACLNAGVLMACLTFSISFTASPSTHSRRQAERQRHSRKLAEMVDRQGLCSAREVHDRKKRHKGTSVAGGNGFGARGCSAAIPKSPDR
jgi:hypothetical protein